MSKVRHKSRWNWRALLVLALLAASVPSLADQPGQYRGADGTRYWYFEGHWYHWSGGRWVAGHAPVGVYVPFISAYYRAGSANGVTYYFADETYYVWNDGKRQFQVVAPPAGGLTALAPVQPAAPAMQPHVGVQPRMGASPAGDTLFVYPKNGQSAEQQKKDRYDCYQWAVGQTGYDPATGAGSPEKHDGFMRSQASCLEGRGYAVK